MSVLVILSTIAIQVREMIWWLKSLSTSVEACRGKLSHIEVRTMCRNLQAHEAVRMFRTWFQTNASRISPMSWLISKLVSELAMWRMSNQVNGWGVSCEALGNNQIG